MSAPTYQDFESTALGSLPAGYVNVSASGAAAAVTAAAPIFGSRSLAFANAADGQIAYDSGSTGLKGVVFAQRLNLAGSSNGTAGALLQTDGSQGYLVYPNIGTTSTGDDYLQILKAPAYSVVGNRASDEGSLSAALGRQPVDGDILWMRAEWIEASSTVRGRAWLGGNAEGTTWGTTAVDGSAPLSGALATGFRLCGGVAGRSQTVDNVQAYDPTVLTAGTPFVVATADTTAQLYSPGASGGVGPYSYQWQRSAGGGAFAPIAGATGTNLADSGLTPGTAYAWQLVVTDTGAGNATATSLPTTATTTGTAPVAATPATGYSLASSSASVVAGSADTITATLTPPGATLASTLTIALNDPGSTASGSILIPVGASTGAATLTPTAVGTHTVTGSHTGGGFTGGDGSTSFTATAAPPAGSTTTWQTAVEGLPAGLVGGTSAGFGYQVAWDGGAYGTLQTTGIIEDIPGDYSARFAGPNGSIPKVLWVSGVGNEAVDSSPLAAPLAATIGNITVSPLMSDQAATLAALPAFMAQFTPARLAVLDAIAAGMAIAQDASYSPLLSATYDVRIAWGRLLHSYGMINQQNPGLPIPTDLQSQ